MNEVTIAAEALAFSEDAVALEFARQHAEHLRYVAQTSDWMIWNGHQWCDDSTRMAMNMARKVCRDEGRRANETGARRRLAQANTIYAVLNLASSDRLLAATVDQWDADPMMLNTPAGVFDLRTGEMRPAMPEDYLTKMTSVAPSDAPAPRWARFLEEVTRGDVELQAFLQRVAGYCLTGLTIEHSLFFIFGPGGNGKSVFVQVLAGILADYARTAAADVFLASNLERHSTGIAELRGARFVSAVETEQDRKWAEALVKSITGGDRISARKMRQDNFSFVPAFKLVMIGNHKPGLRAIDEAMRRRLHLIPFETVIPRAKRDQRLSEKLKTEWPSILTWMIEGCLAWQRVGLQPPGAVLDATEAYMQQEDAVGIWLSECCDREPGTWSQSSDLFRSWKTWAEANGEEPGTSKRLSQTLDARGFKIERRRTGSVFVGLFIRKPNEPL